jgi:hypothetical protein
VVFYVGLDLGQAADYTALGVLERKEPEKPEKGKPADATKDGAAVEQVTYELRHLERFQLGTSYPAVGDRVKELLDTAALAGKTCLVVDATGVGRPVVDLLHLAGLRPIGVVIHGGEQTLYDEKTGFLRAPKRELVSTAQVLLQTRRLRFAAEMPHVKTLVDELLKFEVKITEAGHDTYGAWREGAHDDLVFAVALACWIADRFGGPEERIRQREFRVVMDTVPSRGPGFLDP